MTLSLISYSYDCLIMLLSIVVWFLEIVQLLAEITLLYAASLLITICSSLIYAANLFIVVLTLSMFAVVETTLKLFACVIQLCGTAFISVLLSSNECVAHPNSCKRETKLTNFEDTNEEEVFEYIKCTNDILDEVDYMLAKEATRNDLNPTDNFMVYSDISPILQKSTRSIDGESGIENKQSVERAVGDAAIKDASVNHAENPPVEIAPEDYSLEDSDGELESATNMKICLKEMKIFYQQNPSFPVH